MNASAMLSPPALESKLPKVGTTIFTVMTALASGAISQKVAQAAAWHISSGRTWEQLAAEVISMAGGDPDVPFFTPAELAAARRLVDESAKRHQTASSESSPG